MAVFIVTTRTSHLSRLSPLLVSLALILRFFPPTIAKIPELLHSLLRLQFLDGLSAHTDLRCFDGGLLAVCKHLIVDEDGGQNVGVSAVRALLALVSPDLTSEICYTFSPECGWVLACEVCSQLALA